MFEKLWEWIMGIITWIMSKFSRKSDGEQTESVEDGASTIAAAVAAVTEAPAAEPSE